MSFDIACKNCGAVLEAEEEWRGMKVECPECNFKFIIMRPLKLKTNSKPKGEIIKSNNPYLVSQKDPADTETNSKNKSLLSSNSYLKEPASIEINFEDKNQTSQSPKSSSCWKILNKLKIDKSRVIPISEHNLGELLYWSIRLCDLEMFNYIVKNASNNNLTAAVFDALYFRNYEMAGLLLENGAQVENAFNDAGAPVFWCVDDDWPIYKRKTAVYPSNDDLHGSHSFNTFRILEYEPKPSPKTYFNEHTALEFWELLLAYGANVQMEHQKFGGNALHGASDFDFIRWLLEHGANPNNQDFRGNTRLHSCSSVKIAKLLIDHGADLNLKNNDGLKPSDEIRLNTIGDKEVAEYLESVNV